MEIWVVMKFYYEDWEIASVWDSEEAAEEEYKRLTKKGANRRYSVDSYKLTLNKAYTE